MPSTSDSRDERELEEKFVLEKGEIGGFGEMGEVEL